MTLAPASQLTASLTDDTTGVIIPFNSGADDYGVDWRMRELDGWDSPDFEDATTNRSGGDGLWDSESWYGGRTITLGGTLTAPTYADREAAEYRLRQAVPRNRLVTLVMAETTPKSVDARRSGRLMVRPLSDMISEYSISLLAPDPRKYGTAAVAGTISAAVSGGGLAPPWTPPITIPASGASWQTTLTNAGIYDSPPVITIRGPGSGISILNYTTSQAIVFDLVFGPDDYLVIDVRAGTALLNGTAPRAPQSGSAIIADFLAQPGDNLYGITGTLTSATPPSADISFYSAWI